MSDITMCAGWQHPECATCLRRTAKPDERWQSYIDPPRVSPCYLYLKDGNLTYAKASIHSRSKQQS